MMTQYYKEHYRKFLDDKVPALGGVTPRNAAKDPARRPHLVELMKGHINNNDRLAQDNGVTIDIDWVLRELNLHELLGD